MKSWLVGFICALFCTNCFAEVIQIEVNPSPKETQHTDTRSVKIIPVVTLDNDIINVYSALPIENLQITIKDMVGNIVYSNTISLPGKQGYSFQLETTDEENKNFTIELDFGNQSYIGYFGIF